MTALVTLGPTQEPLDAMRILSNRSTGELGTQLAVALAKAGHQVIALRGTGATADASVLTELGIPIIPFTTTQDLRNALEQTSKTEQITAVFHTSAVSDFHLSGGGSGKIPTSGGPLTLTLEPTQKILPLLRDWFPKAQIIGWKFEAQGDKAEAVAAAHAQIARNRTDACVLNGPSYGEGFGLVYSGSPLFHQSGRQELCKSLLRFLNAS